MFVGHVSPGVVVFVVGFQLHTWFDSTFTLHLSIVLELCIHYNVVEKNVKYTETFQDLATLLLDVVEIGAQMNPYALEHVHHETLNTESTP